MRTILTISRSSLNFIYVTIFIWYIQSMLLFILFGSIYGFSYMLTHDRHCSCHSLLQSPITAAYSWYSVSISFSELSHGMFKKLTEKIFAYHIAFLVGYGIAFSLHSCVNRQQVLTYSSLNFNFNITFCLDHLSM